MAMKENTKKVIRFLQNNDGDYTAADIAEKLELTTKQVDGIFTSAIQNKKMGIREPAEAELADGTHKAIKLLRLTDAGKAFDVDAEPTAE